MMNPKHVILAYETNKHEENLINMEKHKNPNLTWKRHKS